MLSALTGIALEYLGNYSPAIPILTSGLNCALIRLAGSNADPEIFFEWNTKKR